MKAQNTILPNNGSYLLEISILQKCEFAFSGKLHNELRTGFYYYSGSAMTNMQSRVHRHIRKNKKHHWHIDNITALNYSEITRVFIFNAASKDAECDIINLLSKLSDFTVPFQNFGNSDCKNHCPAHLLYSVNPIDQSHLFSLYHEIVLFIPSSRDISVINPISSSALR